MPPSPAAASRSTDIAGTSSPGGLCSPACCTWWAVFPSAVFWYVVLRADRPEGEARRVAARLLHFAIGQVRARQVDGHPAAAHAAAPDRAWRHTVVAASVFFETFTMLAVGSAMAALVLLIWHREPGDADRRRRWARCCCWACRPCPSIFQWLIARAGRRQAESDGRRQVHAGSSCARCDLGWAGDRGGLALAGHEPVGHVARDGRARPAARSTSFRCTPPPWRWASWPVSFRKFPADWSCASGFPASCSNRITARRWRMISADYFPTRAAGVGAGDFDYSICSGLAPAAQAVAAVEVELTRVDESLTRRVATATLRARRLASRPALVVSSAGSIVLRPTCPRHALHRHPRLQRARKPGALARRTWPRWRAPTATTWTSSSSTTARPTARGR